MLKPEAAKLFSAGIEGFNKCAAMADSLRRRPEDAAGDLTVGGGGVDETRDVFKTRAS